MINDLEFPEGDQLLEQALPMGQRIRALKGLADKNGIPTIYVNDNFGHWRSDFRAQVDHCLHDGVRGEAIARLVQPGENDYFVLKPMHSGFYGTVLDILLKHLNAQRLIICGMATNICVLFTANDAYMRGYQLWAPRDCVAANTAELTHLALEEMRTVLKANTKELDQQGLARWARKQRPAARQEQLVRGG